MSITVIIIIIITTKITTIHNNNNSKDDKLLADDDADTDTDASVNDHDHDGGNDDSDFVNVLLKLTSILQRKKEFSFRTRNKIVALAEEYIENLKDDIHDMLCDQ
eukprot:CAMPEP_0171011940 /NCGR_PEP_ID=MMETSP0736-20130129/23222_1 /TAXON_ID=186038 /ORGANISM="Fragilariopsis kerguelensis, Strain L26-C5" /LENGTH=104 /DNA_ID=CAMNT_0011444853 /DNA_START=180 /DNA_END=491 /DNA_ORIENTATION=+